MLTRYVCLILLLLPCLQPQPQKARAALLPSALPPYNHLYSQAKDEHSHDKHEHHHYYQHHLLITSCTHKQRIITPNAYPHPFISFLCPLLLLLSSFGYAWSRKRSWYPMLSRSLTCPFPAHSSYPFWESLLVYSHLPQVMSLFFPSTTAKSMIFAVLVDKLIIWICDIKFTSYIMITLQGALLLSFLRITSCV